MKCINIRANLFLIFLIFLSELTYSHLRPEGTVGFLMDQRPCSHIEFYFKITIYCMIYSFATVFSTTGRIVSILETAII
jgi:hypothetical protein